MYMHVHVCTCVCVCVHVATLQVIRDLSGPPNYWDMDRIENNMFRRYKRSDLDGSLYDADSIMHYRYNVMRFSAWTCIYM